MIGLRPDTGLVHRPVVEAEDGGDDDEPPAVGAERAAEEPAERHAVEPARR